MLAIIEEASGPVDQLIAAWFLCPVTRACGVFNKRILTIRFSGNQQQCELSILILGPSKSPWLTFHGKLSQPCQLGFLAHGFCGQLYLPKQVNYIPVFKIDAIFLFVFFIEQWWRQQEHSITKLPLNISQLEFQTMIAEWVPEQNGGLKRTQVTKISPGKAGWCTYPKSPHNVTFLRKCVKILSLI